MSMVGSPRRERVKTENLYLETDKLGNTAWK